MPCKIFRLSTRSSSEISASKSKAQTQTATRPILDANHSRAAARPGWGWPEAGARAGWGARDAGPRPWGAQTARSPPGATETGLQAEYAGAYDAQAMPMACGRLWRNARKDFQFWKGIPALARNL